MNKTLLILTLSLLFSQELEVEGNLKVTGTVESTTIDSLQQVIANLQAEMASMHADNQLETRVYELPRIYIDNDLPDDKFYLDISSITGYELDYAILKLIRVNDFSIDNDSVNDFPTKFGTVLLTYITELFLKSIL